MCCQKGLSYPIGCSSADTCVVRISLPSFYVSSKSLLNMLILSFLQIPWGAADPLCLEPGYVTCPTKDTACPNSEWCCGNTCGSTGDSCCWNSATSSEYMCGAGFKCGNVSDQILDHIKAKYYEADTLCIRMHAPPFRPSLRRAGLGLRRGAIQIASVQEVFLTPTLAQTSR